MSEDWKHLALQSLEDTREFIEKEDEKTSLVILTLSEKKEAEPGRPVGIFSNIKFECLPHFLSFVVWRLLSRDDINIEFSEVKPDENGSQIAAVETQAAK